MALRDRAQDTICAVSTPSGYGGISVLRLSGGKALEILRSIAPFVPALPESHKIYYGNLKDPKSGSLIDEVLVAWFAENRSFTGESTAEISCHGNPLLCREILQKLIESGAKAAEPGEFTYRAFMNNRLDLVQAESVLSLIESRSSSAARLALRQLQGELSKEIETIEDNLTWSLAHIEAGIDFSTEGLDVVDHAVLRQKLTAAESAMQKLVASFRQGRVLREGLRIALVGRPNVGKSSLLNQFLESDRAIVSNIAGTTRDLLEGETSWRGQRLIFLDTAGLREASETIEKLGIERSHKALQEADLVFFVFDASVGWTPEDQQILGKLDPSRTLLVANKHDLPPLIDPKTTQKTLSEGDFFRAIPGKDSEKLLFVSALDKTIRDDVFRILSDRFQLERAESSSALSSARHFERMSHALECVQQSMSMIEQGLGSEFIAVDLKEALMALQETLGKRFDDQIMDRVFKEFCIGK